MARTKKGSAAEYAHLSQNIRRRRPASALPPALPPSRRRPTGYYSVININTSATNREIRTRCNGLIAELERSKNGQNGKQRSGLSKKIKQVEEAGQFLCDPSARKAYDKQFLFCRSSVAGDRVRVHRANSSSTKKRIVSATTAARKRAVRQARVIVPKRRIADRLVSNFNNRRTSEWIVVKRSKQELSEDLRCGPYLVIPIQECIFE